VLVKKKIGRGSIEGEINTDKEKRCGAWKRKGGKRQKKIRGFPGIRVAGPRKKARTREKGKKEKQPKEKKEIASWLWRNRGAAEERTESRWGDSPQPFVKGQGPPPPSIKSHQTRSKRGQDETLQDTVRTPNDLAAKNGERETGGGGAGSKKTPGVAKKPPPRGKKGQRLFENTILTRTFFI